MTSLLSAVSCGGTGRLCLGTPGSGGETLAREIPSVFMNHLANVFCGPEVLIILLKTNSPLQPAALGELSAAWSVLNSAESAYLAHTHKPTDDHPVKIRCERKTIYIHTQKQPTQMTHRHKNLCIASH